MPRKNKAPITGFLLRKSVQERHESQMSTGGPVTQTAPNFDPQSQTAAASRSFDVGPRLAFGVITDCCSLANAYRVQFDRGRQPMPCYWMPRSGTNVFGAKDCTSIPVGTQVLVVLHPDLTHGLILGALPQSQMSAKRALSDMVSQTTRQRADECHKIPLRLNDGGRIEDKLLRDFFDKLMNGETGWVTETGLRIFLDSFMVQVAADELTGLFVFYHDQLARLGGYNLQLRSSVHETDYLDDQEESSIYTGFALYPWEQMGLFSRGNPAKVNSPATWQTDARHYAAIEPSSDYLQPFHRTMEFHGYLGQLGKLIGCSKPDGGSTYEYEGGSSSPRDLQLPGLFDSAVHADGRWAVQSAKGISIVKRSAPIVPQRCQRPEQPGLGDNPDNYKHSGVAGNGASHKITGDIETTAGDAMLQRITAIHDLHAYLFNYAGLHPFFWHGSDWHLAEESALGHTSGSTVKAPGFSDLDGGMYLHPPTPYRLDIDHRLSGQEFYQNECGFDLLKDGGTCFFDGFGSEERSTAGCRFISAPGDIWLKAGRNIVLWAGGDVQIAGRRNVEINATEKDVRLKAENNMQLVAGNSGEGGILLESRATYDVTPDFEKVGDEVVSAGVMVKCRSSAFTTWAKDIYLRTGGGNVDGNGIIMVDANGGWGGVMFKAGIVSEYLTTAHYMHFGYIQSEDGFQINKSNEFTENITSICSPFQANGQGIFDEGLIVRGWILCPDGHIATEIAASNPFVAPLTDLPLQQAYEAADDVETRTTKEIPEIGNTVYSTADTHFYTTGAPGDEALIEKAEFTWRTVDQMQTHEWRLWEDRWQHMSRLTEQNSPTWTEKDLITVVEGAMKPYPGKSNWEDPTYYEQDLEIFDLRSGHSKDRGSAPNLAAHYSQPRLEPSPPKPLEGTYTVVRE